LLALASSSMDPWAPSCRVRIQPWARTTDWIKLSLCALSDASFPSTAVATFLALIDQAISIFWGALSPSVVPAIVISK
jgi:hypothetical protein